MVAGNYATNKCMKFNDTLHEFDPLTRANKVDTKNPYVRMVYSMVSNSILDGRIAQRIAQVEGDEAQALLQKLLEEDKDKVLRKIPKQVCFIDRSIICSKN